MTTKKQVNVAVLVSGGGTNLQALIDAQNAGVITDGKIVLVVSNKQGAYALERAKNNCINSATVLKKDYATQTDFEIFANWAMNMAYWGIQHQITNLKQIKF